MSDGPSKRRIVMSKLVAARWLRRKASPEHRFTVYGAALDAKSLPGLLRSFRDGKVAMEGVKPLPDLGVKEQYDVMSVWSRDRAALMTLKDWFEKRGFETTGIW